MTQRPSELRIDFQIEVRIGIVHDLIHFELVETQEPVRLIQTVLPYQRRLLQSRQPIIIFIDGDKSGIIDTFHRRTLIEGGRKAKDILIRIGRRPDNHLRALSGRNKTRGMAKTFPLFGTL